MTDAMRKTASTARKAAAEGIVMLENKNGALPLKRGEKIAIFGRCQIDYNAGGTGSGGSVHTEYQSDILSALENSGASVNRALADFYRNWVSKNPPSDGGGMWASRPLFREEPELDDGFVRKTAESSDTAVMVIGRSAGEEQDSFFGKGGWLLTDTELNTLKALRGYFKKVIVLLNVPAVIDTSWAGELKIDALLYIWQGGQEGGEAVADVLCGVSPSGRLTDTIAKNYSDYPSSAGYDEGDKIYYKEDIFVGYRYFESFCPEKVLYPFGFGLSYTEFKISCRSAVISGGEIRLKAAVRNMGKMPGKEVVQVYAEPPECPLPRPKITLAEFAKTHILSPGEEQELEIKFPLSRLSYYDDRDACYRVDKGVYRLVLAKNVRDRSVVVRFELYKDEVLRRCRSLAAPTEAFERLCGFDENGPLYEKTPVKKAERRRENLPAEVIRPGKKKFMLHDVREGNISINEFVAPLSNKDLACICRGEGMNSKHVRPGTGTAFGGVSRGLSKLGIPAAAGTDGPSGLRFDNGDKATLVPIGTMLACSWNKKLIFDIYRRIGGEMRENGVDLLLGPGFNIHRNPLCGRNFEYFSEDPYVSGAAAASALNGLRTKHVCGTLKHIAANNREKGRKTSDSILSERALREIYLKPLEYAVELSKPEAIMTAYNAVNGEMCGSNYEMLTGIIRGEYGFSGMIMTDWWAGLGRASSPSRRDSAAMLRAGCDIYMVHKSPKTNSGADNTLAALKDGSLTRGELQQAAKNILRLVMKLPCVERGK